VTDDITPTQASANRRFRGCAWARIAVGWLDTWNQMNVDGDGRATDVRRGVRDRAEYRGLPVENLANFNGGAGFYHVATPMEAQMWKDRGAASTKIPAAIQARLAAIDMKECFNERFRGFSLTTFDGRTITV